MLIIAAAMVLRIPLLTLGFGLDPDAYRSVLAAERLATGGGYETSRLPGYPVHEYLLYFTGAFQFPLYANLLSASFFAIASFFLLLVLRTIEPSTALPYAIAFLAMPLALKPSSETMDYSLSLVLLVISLYLITRSKPYHAAFFLGASTASRITNGAALIAALPLILRAWPWNQVKSYLWFLIVFSLSWAVFFSPVIATYGADFFTFYDNNSELTPSEIVSKGLFGSWGIIGAYVSGVCLALAIARGLREPEKLRSPYVQSGGLLFLLYWVAFFRLPHEVEYLLPATLGFLMILSCLVTNKTIAWVFALAVTASTVSPALSYYEKRKARWDLVTCLTSRLAELPQNAVVVVRTTMELAYFSRSTFRTRPDLEIRVKTSPELGQTTGQVYVIHGSIYQAPQADCAIPILPLAAE